MMQNKRNKWLNGIGAVAFIGGLILANFGGGITPVEAHDRQKHQGHHVNPFKQISDKLDEVLDKVKSGGGGAIENSTMRWDTHNPSASRFTVLTEFGGAAVRDNNTGLVWEQTPTMTLPWVDARFQCLNKPIGGARGWRLPSVVELASLIDPSLVPPYVPVVFTGVTGNYWSATSIADSGSTSKFSVSFTDGLVGSSSKTLSNNVWCVRGSMNEPTY